MKRIYADERYCIGCRLCEVHCLVRHSRSRHIIKAFREERATAQPRVLVEQSGYTTFALQCRHCDEAPCLEACMSGAMHRDQATGAVLCDQDKCVGCWMCVMVCPLGAIGVPKADIPASGAAAPGKGPQRKVASKCDLCEMEFEDAPPCVANCPNEALKYEDRDRSAGNSGALECAANGGALECAANGGALAGPRPNQSGVAAAALHRAGGRKMTKDK